MYILTFIWGSARKGGEDGHFHQFLNFFSRPSHSRSRLSASSAAALRPIHMAILFEYTMLQCVEAFRLRTGMTSQTALTVVRGGLCPRTLALQPGGNYLRSPAALLAACRWYHVDLPESGDATGVTSHSTRAPARDITILSSLLYSPRRGSSGIWGHHSHIS